MMIIAIKSLWFGEMNLKLDWNHS